MTCKEKQEYYNFLYGWSDVELQGIVNGLLSEIRLNSEFNPLRNLSEWILYADSDITYFV